MPAFFLETRLRHVRRGAWTARVQLRCQRQVQLYPQLLRHRFLFLLQAPRSQRRFPPVQPRALQIARPPTFQRPPRAHRRGARVAAPAAVRRNTQRLVQPFILALTGHIAATRFLAAFASTTPPPKTAGDALATSHGDIIAVPAVTEHLTTWAILALSQSRQHWHQLPARPPAIPPRHLVWCPQPPRAGRRPCFRQEAQQRSARHGRPQLPQPCAQPSNRLWHRNLGTSGLVRKRTG